MRTEQKLLREIVSTVGSIDHRAQQIRQYLDHWREEVRSESPHPPSLQVLEQYIFAFGDVATVGEELEGFCRKLQTDLAILQGIRQTREEEGW